MPREFSPKVVTASDLLIGDVIYQTSDDGWTRDLARAEVITDEAHAQLRLLNAEQQPDRLIGAYLADVALDTGNPEPIHFREDFRRTGPSNYAHGKQQELGNV